MKSRMSKVLNFFAFNILFFALYLNFIHTDNNTNPVVQTNQPTSNVKGTVLVDNPEQYLKKIEAEHAQQHSSTINKNPSALKSTFN